MVRKLTLLAFASLWFAGCSCGAPGDTNGGTGDDDIGTECSDVDNDGYGVGAGCEGNDCDDSNPAVWSQDQCDALCAEDPHSTGCECDQAQFPEPEICYSGAAETLGLGACRAGLRTCEDGRWSPCDGQVLPGTEICDGTDNNCDGGIDEGVQNECGGWGDCNETCVGAGEGCTPWDITNEGNNVEECEGDPNCVTLGGRTISLHVLWAVNTSQGSISHLDTDTREEVGRYYTSDNGAAASPSRTSVDYNGDVVVGNRNFGGVGSVTRIAAEACPAGDTSEGNELLAWGDDACVLWHSEVGNAGGIARAVAVQDRAGLDGSLDERVWVGLYSEHRYVELDRTDGSETGDEANVSPCTPYGAAIDRDGNLWSACLSQVLARFDTEDTGDVQTWNMPASNYGITVDEDGIVWTGGSCQKYDPDADEFTVIAGCGGSGIASDGDGGIWVGGCWGGGGGGTCRIDAEDLTVTSNTAQSRGFGVTFNGELWAVSWNSFVDIITPDGPDASDAAVERVDFGLVGPYCYTDMTGFQLRNATDPQGYISHIFTGCDGEDSTYWTGISWDALIPAGTGIDISVRAAETLEALSAAAWTNVGSAASMDSPHELGDLLGDGPHGKYLEIKAILISADHEHKPELMELGGQFLCDVPIS